MNKFHLNELVILQSKGQPERNGEYVVIDVKLAPQCRNERTGECMNIKLKCHTAAYTDDEPEIVYSTTVGKVYDVVRISGSCFVIVDDQGIDYHFDFEQIDEWHFSNFFNVVKDWE
jgi:hypothetical protein